MCHTHARNYLRTFGFHEIFKCAHFKVTVYGRKQPDIHTTSANTLVWASLRLTPIIYTVTLPYVSVEIKSYCCYTVCMVFLILKDHCLHLSCPSEVHGAATAAWYLTKDYMYLILLVFNFDQDAQVTKVNVYTNILRVKYVLTYSVLLDFTLFIHAATSSELQQHFERRHSTDIPSLKDVFTELKPALLDWYELGLFLDISPYKLDSIRKDYHDTHHAFRTMLRIWLEQSVEPTWETIVEALSIVGDRALAEEIRARHCYSQ